MRYFWFVFLFFIAAYLVPLAGRPMIVPDEFRYTKTTNTILGQFIGNGVMQAVYGSSVPAGWLMPLNYLRLSSSSRSIPGRFLTRLQRP